MLPNLYGVDFKAGLKALLQTPLPPEYAEIEAAVKSSGMAKTEWVRTKLIAAARRA